MSEAVLFFQIGIFSTILITRLFWKDNLGAVCGLWTIFTFVMVYASPLLLLQLIVIWGSYGLLAPKEKPENEKIERRQHQDRVAQKLGVLAQMNDFLIEVEKGAKNLEAKTAKKLDVSRSTDKLKLAISIEKSRIDMALDVANTEIKNGLNVSTSQWSYQYRKVKAAREASPNTHNHSPKTPSVHLSYLQLDAVYRGNPEIYQALIAMKSEHDTYLKSIFKTLLAEPDLSDLFFDAMDAIGGAGKYDHLKSEFDRYASEYSPVKIAPPPAKKADEVFDLQRSQSLGQPSPKAEKGLTDINKAALEVLRISFEKEEIRKNSFKRSSQIDISQLFGGENAKPFDVVDNNGNYPEGVKFLGRIEHLYHFTNLENIESILSNGLMPVDDMEARGIEFSNNDKLRLDGHLGALSLSISHPNEKLFYRWRMSDWAIDWVVLQISPLCLVDEKSENGLVKCAFYPWNAADKKSIILDTNDLGTEAAFDAMFALEVGDLNRADQILSYGDPTDVQAEILKFGAIEPKFINKAIFKDRSTLEKWREHFDAADIPVELDTTGLFGLRSKARQKAKAKV